MSSHDRGNGRLRKLVAKAPPAEPQLPLVHSTDGYLFTNALFGGALEPQPCHVFDGEPLLYTFYGRPSFRPNAGELATTMDHYLPVCLIFKRSFAHEIRRIFPFDSGAFVNDFYRTYLHKKMALDDFLLEPDLKTPGQVVSAFFGSARSYLQARPGNTAEFDAAEFEAKSYATLIDARDSNAMDSRGSGIEVQIGEPISIEEWIDAVVVPSTFLQSSIGDEIRRLKITILPYDVQGRLKPSEYTATITDKCLHHYATQGLLEEVLR